MDFIENGNVGWEIYVSYFSTGVDHGRETWGAAGAAAPQNNDWGGRVCILPPPNI